MARVIDHRYPHTLEHLDCVMTQCSDILFDFRTNATGSMERMRHSVKTCAQRIKCLLERRIAPVTDTTTHRYCSIMCSVH